MSKPLGRSLTAAQEVLLGANDLNSSGKSGFSEWDLTVATWKRNPHRFGCRGYEDMYPDHKRVMTEIMGITKKDNPIRRGWIEKFRPNTYRITSLGTSEAERLQAESDTNHQLPRSPQAIYDAVSPYYENRAFQRHVRDPDEPRLWMGAASFLQLTRNDAQHVEDRVRAAGAAISNALAWLDETGADKMRSGVVGGKAAISRADLLKLQAFRELLLNRFADQFTAIQAKSGI